MPLVSIITPIFNPDEKHLISMIKSVQSQVFQDYEHIIIDDFSSEPLPKKVELLIDLDSKITLIRRCWNAGPAVTRNCGIEHAQGQFIAFLDADDEWEMDKLYVQINYMLDNNIGLSYTAYNIIDINGNLISNFLPPKYLSYKDVLMSNRIGCLTAVYNTKILGKIFMPNIEKRQDMGLWLRILKCQDFAFGIIDRSYGSYRLSNGSISSNKFGVLKYQWRLYREIEKLSFLSSSYYFTCYIFFGVKNKLLNLLFSTKSS